MPKDILQVGPLQRGRITVSVPEHYGRKGVQSREQVSAINAVDPPVIQKMREILMPAKQRADRGELTVLKPWLSARGA